MQKTTIEYGTLQLCLKKSKHTIPNKIFSNDWRELINFLITWDLWEGWTILLDAF